MMLFDEDALRGIYEALSEHDRKEVWDYAERNSIKNFPFGSQERVEIAYNALVHFGHIIPIPSPPAYEAYAEEYEETMQALDLMGD